LRKEADYEAETGTVQLMVLDLVGLGHFELEGFLLTAPEEPRMAGHEASVSAG